MAKKTLESVIKDIESTQNSISLTTKTLERQKNKLQNLQNLKTQIENDEFINFLRSNSISKEMLADKFIDLAKSNEVEKIEEKVDESDKGVDTSGF